MKKMIISLLLCMVMVFGSIVAWLYYLDLLAGSLFIGAIIPSCLFEEGRQEYKANGTRKSL